MLSQTTILVIALESNFKYLYILDEDSQLDGLEISSY